MSNRTETPKTEASTRIGPARSRRRRRPVRAPRAFRLLRMTTTACSATSQPAGRSTTSATRTRSERRSRRPGSRATVRPVPRWPPHRDHQRGGRGRRTGARSRHGRPLRPLDDAALHRPRRRPRSATRRTCRRGSACFGVPKVGACTRNRPISRAQPSRGGRTRTCNPRFWRPVLCQLSYAPWLRHDCSRGSPRPVESRAWPLTQRRALGALFLFLAVFFAGIAFTRDQGRRLGDRDRDRGAPCWRSGSGQLRAPALLAVAHAEDSTARRAVFSTRGAD